MLPIYTAYLTPSDYGMLALLASIIAVFELFLGARFSQAVPKFYFDEDSESGRACVIGTAFLFTSAASFVALVAIVMTSEFAASVVADDSKFQQYLSLYSVTIITLAIENYGLSYIRLLERSVLYVTLSILKLISQLGLNILFVVYIDLGVLGVIISTIASSGIFAIVLSVFTLRRVRFRFSMRIANRLLIFSWPLWVAGIAAIYSNFANLYLIRYFADLANVGLFELAARFGALVAILAWHPFSDLSNGCKWPTC